MSETENLVASMQFLITEYSQPYGVVKTYQYITNQSFAKKKKATIYLFVVKSISHNMVIFSCDQAALQMVFSVCPSVCLSVCPSVRPSVCHTFLTMFPSSYHHEIFRSYYQWQKWRPCKRSRSEVKGQGHRGHNPTLPFPDCNSSLNSRVMMKWCI